MKNENCLEYQILINEKLDNEINVNDELILSAHLKECSECESYYTDLKSMKNSFNKMPNILASDEFEERLYNKIKASKIVDINLNRSGDNNVVFKKQSFLSKFTSYAAGIAIVAFAFVALEKSNFLDSDKNIIDSFNSTSKTNMATIIDSSNNDNNNIAIEKDAEKSVLDSLEKLKTKPYININDLKHSVSNEDK